MHIVAKIIRHELSSDNAPVVEPGMPDGITISSFVPNRRHRRKVVLYMEFSANCASMKSALHVLYGINSVVLDGKTPVPKRRLVVQRWTEGFDMDNQACRVLIITSVAGVGINLSAADRLIIFVSLVVYSYCADL